MAKIMIVGAGQSGLQLGIGLVQDGHEVTVVSNRTPDDIRDGRVMSSQCMFAPHSSTSATLGIDFWDDTCPPIEGISLAVPHPEIGGGKAIDWAARLDRPAQSVDQRVKFPRWMEQLRVDRRRARHPRRRRRRPRALRETSTTSSSSPPARARSRSSSSATPSARRTSSRCARSR